MKIVYGISLAVLIAVAPDAQAFDPLTSLAGEAITTTMDVRTKAEVKNDLDISTSANKRLLDDKRAEWSGVTLLVFAQHVVLAGAVKSDDMRKLVEEIVGKDKRIRSLKNEIVVIRKKGDEGSLANDKPIDVKVNATLTSTKGIGSVNMRWKTVNGTVVIMGAAQSDGESRLAVSKIRGLDGVKGVKNYLRIVSKKK